MGPMELGGAGWQHDLVRLVAGMTIEKPKRETFRVHMGWLHSWVGLLAGFILTAIFATGTLSVFDTEITHWMQPEAALTDPPALTAHALQSAVETLEAEKTKGFSAFLNLPSVRDPFIRVVHYDGAQFIGPVLDPQTGSVLPARETAGGQFFFDFHYTLRSGPVIGSTIVTIFAVCLLVAVGAGVAIHIKAIWPDLVLFRPFGPRPRAWLDAHLLTGLLFLPFLIMMTYTGAVIRGRNILPPHPFLAAHTELDHPKGNGRRANDTSTEKAASPIPPLLPLIEQAKTALNLPECSFILFSDTEVRIFGNDTASVFMNRDMAVFSRTDGHFLSTSIHREPASQATALMHGLHYARFPSLLLRWLYFVSGLACTAMMAIGLILFFIKRRRASGDMLTFRLGEGLTMSCVTGLTASTLAFFWANRLLPATLPNRIHSEVSVFFILWALSFVHGVCFSLCKKPLPGWKMQTQTVLVLALGLPLLDAAGQSHDWSHNPELYYSVDGLLVLTGLIAFMALKRMKRAEIA
ncbi:MAG: PepSY-associated TM helix domain-containing protein [Acetobacter sp.]|uniref:PepSY-associated TM helix domain-containing protein n=1 Tax=Acetobacter sp. TaxID=440 RepID=UPI003F91171E